MKKTVLFLLATIVFLGCASVQASSLIVNGSFESPSVDGSWSTFANGDVPGWYNSQNNDGTEIDYTAILGIPAYNDGGDQSMEVNGATYDTISQDVTGLTVGDWYILSWAYAARPNYGSQQVEVTFGGQPVKTISGGGSGNSSSNWTLYSVAVLATDTTETLSFAAVDMSACRGKSDGGNEIDAVSLVPTPEPSSVLLLGTGLASLLLALKRKQKS